MRGADGGRPGRIVLKAAVAQHAHLLPQTHARPIRLRLVVAAPRAVGVSKTTRPLAVTTTFLTVVRLRRPL